MMITSKVIDAFDKNPCSVNIKDYIAISGGKIKDTGGKPHDLIQNLHRQRPGDRDRRPRFHALR